VSELLDQLAVSGHEHGLLVERLDVLEARQSGGYRVMPWTSVVGRYPALRAWLEQWLQQVRLLNVARLELFAVDQRSGLVRAKLQVHAYDAAQKLAVPVSLADEPARQAVTTRHFDPFLAWSSRLRPEDWPRSAGATGNGRQPFAGGAAPRAVAFGWPSVPGRGGRSAGA
jgi:type IV pilus assembly protein PilP